MSVEPKSNINGSAKARAKHSLEASASASSSQAVNAACPFIGLEDDPSTRLMFASPAACCHRADPASEVDLTHQQEYCLTSVHKLCPVFMKPEWGPLPPALRYHEPVVSSPKRRWLWLLVGLVVLGLIAIAFIIWGNGRFMPESNTNPGETLPALAVISTPTVTPTATDVSTKTAVSDATLIPSATQMPSVTPMPTETNPPPATATPLPSATPTNLPTTEPTATLVPTYTPVPPTETAVPVMQAVIAVPFLNVRSGPGTFYEQLATIAEGDEFEITGRISDSSWWQICCIVGESGWVIGEAVEVPAEASRIVPTVSGLPLPPTVTAEP